MGCNVYDIYKKVVDYNAKKKLKPKVVRIFLFDFKL